MLITPGASSSNGFVLWLCDIPLAYKQDQVVLKYPFIKIIDYDEAYVNRFGKGHHFIGANGYRAPEVVLGNSSWNLPCVAATSFIRSQLVV